MGAHPLWLAEWLSERIPLKSGMRILDLGCGSAKSSVFFAKEFDVQVWATDLWTSAAENRRRVEDAGVEDKVFPIHADARNLPFADEFFDAIVCVDSYNYFGTDDLFLNYLVRFLRPHGLFGFISAGLVQEFELEVPAHLKRFWGSDCWNIHTADWWRQHLEKTTLVDIRTVQTLDDGWKLWLEWAEAIESAEWFKETLIADAGSYLGYVGLVASRAEGRSLAEYAWPSTLASKPLNYVRNPIFREP